MIIECADGCGSTLKVSVDENGYKLTINGKGGTPSATIFLRASDARELQHELTAHLENLAIGTDRANMPYCIWTKYGGEGWQLEVRETLAEAFEEYLQAIANSGGVQTAILTRQLPVMVFNPQTGQSVIARTLKTR